MEFLAIGLATLIIVLWFLILLAWLMTFGTSLSSDDAWSETSWKWPPAEDRAARVAEKTPMTPAAHRRGA